MLAKVGLNPFPQTSGVLIPFPVTSIPTGSPRRQRNKEFSPWVCLTFGCGVTSKWSSVTVPVGQRMWLIPVLFYGVYPDGVSLPPPPPPPGLSILFWGSCAGIGISTCGSSVHFLCGTPYSFPNPTPFVNAMCGNEEMKHSHLLPGAKKKLRLDKPQGLFDPNPPAFLGLNL